VITIPSTRNALRVTTYEIHVIRSACKKFLPATYYLLFLKWINVKKNMENRIQLETEKIASDFLNHILDFTFAFRKNELIFGAAYNALTIIKLKKLEIPLPSLSIQHDIVARIEREQAIVRGNKELIETFEAKIRKVIDKVWEE
jgi:restriction endonuclease S subunit